MEARRSDYNTPVMEIMVIIFICERSLQMRTGLTFTKVVVHLVAKGNLFVHPPSLLIIIYSPSDVVGRSQSVLSIIISLCAATGSKLTKWTIIAFTANPTNPNQLNTIHICSNFATLIMRCLWGELASVREICGCQTSSNQVQAR